MQELKEMREVNAEPEPPRKVYVQFCKTQSKDTVPSFSKFADIKTCCIFKRSTLLSRWEIALYDHPHQIVQIQSKFQNITTILNSTLLTIPFRKIKAKLQHNEDTESDIDAKLLLQEHLHKKTRQFHNTKVVTLKE